MQSNKRIVIIATITIISLFVLIILFYGIPKEISKNFIAYEFIPNETNSGEEVNVQMEGVYRNPVVGNAIFTGNMVINKYDLTESYEMLDLNFDSVFYENMATLTYISVIDGKPKLELYGSVWLVDRDFVHLIITLNENAKLGIKDGTKVVIPAKDYNEAFDLYNNLIAE
ncbi:hypothetical protein [Alkalihalobacillus pseudalcaliphilus]|uniref:hypothetical protein n=1 Tax=Alkalihalobacillus pseudalcaliphilus TaxID=79884 RepID=UPI00064E1490|nr:hypothetical protein [Alkalihalobacillus pseudalcaliphilus]KMK75789.1 hypothetical protein AB990_11005 [Alkalihalobacillus pseudalcaliphilus]